MYIKDGVICKFVIVTLKKIVRAILGFRAEIGKKQKEP